MLCPLCKGRRPVCIHNYQLLPGLVGKTIGKDFFGPSYSIFVGRANYPNVSIGPMSSIEHNLILDNPSKWFGLPYERIIEYRYLLLRSKQTAHVRNNSRFVEDNQLISMSEPVDIELTLKRSPSYNFEFSSIMAPSGPVADIEKFRIAENLKISQKLDKIASDDIKAQEAAVSIYNLNKDIYKLSSILSSGAIGMKKKIVPTKWSITAIDDIVAKDLIDRVKDYQSVNEFFVYTSEYLDNHFEILLMPGNWEFENLESWISNNKMTFFESHLSCQGKKYYTFLNNKKPIIIPESEGFMGRKKYAFSQSGGYYASRLGVAEGLNNMRKQARVVCFREIYEGYSVPMGVWVVRESVRNAMKQTARKFNTLDEALIDINTRLRVPIREYMRNSVSFRQRRLGEF
ncbi:MAG: hypothetical protein HZB65_03345 [Candidatus Aenigmarchaeota archaeon]|nr:hypothetical protein [Candidatus Aenigmarchaeota archaeon]